MERDARHAEAVSAARAAHLLTGVTVVHHKPEWAAGVTMRGSGRRGFLCDWCDRLVRRDEMLSSGGFSVWTADRSRVTGRGEVGCWEVFGG